MNPTPDLTNIFKKYNYIPPASQKVQTPATQDDWYSDVSSRISQSSPQTTPAPAVPGSESALLPAKPAGETGMGLTDALKMPINALGDVGNLTKGATYGTVKNLAYNIPKEAIGLVKEQGLGDATKNFISSLPEGVAKTAWSLIPQSLKEIANTNAISKIPEEFKALATQNGGSYVQAFKNMVDAIPESLGTAFKDYADQLDRARQAGENHPINELLGYMALKSIIEHPSETLDQTKEGLKNTGELIRHPIKSLESVVDTSIKPAIDYAKDKINDVAYNARVKEFQQAFNQSKTTKAGEIKFGKDSANFASQLEQEGVDLPVSKDVRGKADWSTAIDNVQEIASRDNKAMSRLLDSSGTSINLDQAESEAITSAKSEFKGTAQGNAIENIKNEFNAYKEQYKDVGFTNTDGELNVPSKYANEIKSDLWSKSKFNALSSPTDQTIAGSNYLSGKVFQSQIEDVIPGEDALVHQLNQRLGDYQSLTQTMQKANGGIVHGGFMGKMTTRALGGIAGATHGPVGVAVGAITGDMISDALSNPNASLAKYILARAENEVPDILQQVENQIGINHQTILDRPRLPAPDTIYMKPTQNGQEYTPNQRVYQGDAIAGQRDFQDNQANQMNNANTTSNIDKRVSQSPDNVNTPDNELNFIKKAQDYIKNLPNKEGGFIKNPLAKDTSGVPSDLGQAMARHITSGEQILADPDMKVPEFQVINHVKTNIIDDLQNVAHGVGHGNYASIVPAIQKLDPSSFSSIDDFSHAVFQILQKEGSKTLQGEVDGILNNITK